MLSQLAREAIGVFQMRKSIVLSAAGLALAAMAPIVANAQLSYGQNPVVLDNWCASNGYTLHRNGTQDDSQCVSQAASYASSNNRPLYVPSGGPILMGGGYQATLNNLKMYSDSWQDRGRVSDGAYGYQAAVFWMTDTSKSPFLLGGQSATVDGINFYWPNQVNTNSTPYTYPALFSLSTPTGGSQAFKFRHGNVINAYDFLDVHQGTIGDVDIGDSDIWAIRYAFQLYSVPEILSVHDCLFSYGVSGLTGGNLPTWYAAHGAWLVVYGNGTSTSESSVAVELQTSNVYVFGARYGIHVLGGSGTAGAIYEGQLVGGGFDQVQTILQADTYSYVGGFLVSNQYWYAAVWNQPSALISNGAVYANAASSFDASFDNLWVTANGTTFNAQQTGGFLRIRNNYANACNGVSSGTCQFVSTNGNIAIQGNYIVGYGSGATVYGVSTTGLSNISGNTFVNMTNSVYINTTGPSVLVSDNQSANTSGAHDIAGTFGSNVTVGTNAWSKP